MTRFKQNSLRWMAATAILTLSFSPAMLPAQSATGASQDDTKFLNDLAQDSNFEIKTSQLALQHSRSADVKAYANMVIHDHSLLKQRIRSADQAAGLQPTPPDSLSSEDQSTVSKLSGLDGDAFDQAYIKELVEGNDQIQKEEKSEAGSSSLLPVKSLATRSVAIDTRHAAQAKQLAQAHNVNS